MSTSAYSIYYELTLASYSILPLYIMRLAPTRHRPFLEIYKGYFVPITYFLESLVVMLSTGFFGNAIGRQKQRLYRILAFWLGLEQSLWPLKLTMVRAHLRFRYT